jgi:hypothetical protein
MTKTGEDGSAAAPSTSAVESRSDASRWRRIVGAVLVVVGCLLVPLSLSAVWVRNTLLDTDNYVSTVGPLASDPQIQQALADKLTNAIFTRVDVNQKIADALPPRAGFLAAPVANALRTTTDQAALRLVESSRFQTLWDKANRRAHAAVVNVLTGGGSRVSTENGTVAINTGQIVDNVKAKLDAKGINIFDKVTVPASSQQFVLFQSDDLEQAQGFVDFLQTIAWVLPFLALACLAGAVAVSKHRRRTIQRGAIGVALAVGVQLVLLKTGRSLYLDAVTTKNSTPGAAGAVWDQVTSFLRTAGITVIVLALLIAVGAWVAGPSSAATRLRSWWHRTLGRSGESADEAAPAGAVAMFVTRYTPALRGVGVAIAFVVLIAWTNPTALTVLVIALVLLVYLAVVEFLGRAAKTQPHVGAPR